MTDEESCMIDWHSLINNLYYVATLIHWWKGEMDWKHSYIVYSTCDTVLAIAMGIYM